MRLSELDSLLFSCWKHNPKQSIFVMGPPGVGKTSIAKNVAERIRAYNKDNNIEKKVVCHVKDLSSSLPEDLNGLPKTDGAVMRFVPDTWLAECCDPDACGVLILDDLPAASAGIQVAARQLVLEKRIHEHKISENVIVVVTGNRREDASSAKTLPAHFRNSVLIINADPVLSDWTKWMHSVGGDRDICDFLQFRPQFFSRLPSQADERGVFATPRTWKMLSDMLPVAKETKLLFDIASGLVGSGVATEFIAYKEMSESVPNPKDVIDNPQKLYPDSHDIWNKRPDMMIAVLSAISNLAAKSRKTKNEDIMGKYVRALAYFCTRSTEYFEFAASCYKDSGGKEDKIVMAVIEAAQTDPEVAKLTEKMTSVFS